MRSTPLHVIGDTLREWLLAVPLPMARLLFVGVNLAFLLWVFAGRTAEGPAPEGGVDSPGGLRGEWHLKLVAALALGLQIAIYALV
jgi:hypothetical protein